MDPGTFMARALELAAKGWPAVAPNPMVGAVIVCKGQIVSEGYHERFGGPHAEVNAIRNLPKGVDPAACELYVTLEPCDHFGKTPPCSQLIIGSGIKKVIVASFDPNPLVSGKGIARLRNAGIAVHTGFLEPEARALNKRFMTFHEKGRPYIILKWALSSDGFIARPFGAAREDNFITRKPAQQLVHRLRAETTGIMVGKTTVLNDNPVLTVRHAQGKNPVRFIIDRNLQVPREFNVFNGEAPTVVFNVVREGAEGNISWVKFADTPDLIDQVVEHMYNTGVQSLLVEGGTKILQSFLDKGLWDEAMVFQNPDLQFGVGLKGPVFPLKNTFELIGEDKLYRDIREVGHE